MNADIINKLTITDIFQYNFAGSYCLAGACTIVPTGFFSTPVSTGSLVALTNIFATDDLAKAAGAGAVGGLAPTVAVGGACSINTAGCASTPGTPGEDHHNL